MNSTPFGLNRRPTAPRLFARIAGEVCDRILEVGNNANGRGTGYRTDRRRLRGALAAAVDLEQESGDNPHRLMEAPRQQSTEVNKRDALELWRGLRKITVL